MRRALLLAAAFNALVAAAPPGDFHFEPVPRWAQDPETETVCAAIRAECATMLKDDQIEAEFTYDDLYDPEGMLAGVRMVTSTGCKPLDEHLLLSERDFRTAFSQPGKPDLDDIRLEMAPGIPKDKVRIAKRGTTSATIGC